MQSIQTLTWPTPKPGVLQTDIKMFSCQICSQKESNAFRLFLHWNEWGMIVWDLCGGLGQSSSGSFVVAFTDKSNTYVAAKNIFSLEKVKEADVVTSDRSDSPAAFVLLVNLNRYQKRAHKLD